MVIVLKHNCITLAFAGANGIQDDTNDSDSVTRPAMHRRTELRYSDWNVLDSVLSSSVFPVLKTFQISVKTIREREVDPVTLSDMFPELKNKGVQVICT